MANNNSTIATLHHLLDDEARRFISAEIALKKILPDWINKSNSLKLRLVLQKYLAFTEEHIKNLESFIEAEEINFLQASSRIMKAFIEETEDKMAHCSDAEVKDACLLASIQLINHYKISSYGTAAAFAHELQMEKQASFFREAEVNEKQIDDRLSQLAEHEINIRAKAPVVLSAL